MVRSDLSPGMQLAQACHGMAEFARDHPDEFAAWMATSNYIVILGVPAEREGPDALLDWVDRLSGRCGPQASLEGIQYTLVHEPDINEHTALVIAPSHAWPEFAHLPLAGQHSLRECETRDVVGGREVAMV